MTLIRSRTALALSAAVALGALATSPARAANTITYQGQLAQNGLDVTGTRNMVFSLWNSSAGGAQISPNIIINNVPVDSGLFQVELDFTGQEVGPTTTNRWLQVTVEGNVLSPRQRLTASPYSLQTRGIMVQDDGDVGMGTNSPLFDLHVKELGTFAIGDPPATFGLEYQVAGIGTPPRDWLTMRVGGGLLTPLGQDGSHIIRDDNSKLHISTEPALGSGSLTPQVTVTPAGDVGVGDTQPIARLHVNDGSIGMTAANLENDDIVIESADSILGIYSSGGGTRGSGIALGQVNSGVLADKWFIGRNTTNSDSALYMKYGPNSNHNLNTTMLIAKTNGDLDVTGRVLTGPNNVSTAYAFGRISSGGTILSATSNVTSVARNGNVFDIAITGFNPSTDVVTATARGSDDVCTVSNNGNLLRVYTNDLSVMIIGITSGGFWSPSAVPFDFVVYKP